jgi:hypothetical protein
MGYARTSDSAQSLNEQHGTIADEIPQVPTVGIEDNDELDSFIRELRDAAGAGAKDVQWAR